MHTGRHYSLKEVAVWTRRETILFVLIAAVPTALHAWAGWTWLGVSWLPIALIGAAVAFITGFKNNASYARTWEARQIWGAIVNSSRTWGILVNALIEDPEARRRLFYRHFAWLTALRFQLREPRGWETMNCPDNVEYRRRYKVPEWESNLEEELAPLLSEADLRYVLARKNRAAHLIHMQSQDVRSLTAATAESELRRLELERTLAALIETQGKCERIKNFPYPRQFATLNLFFVWLLIAVVPLGLLREFERFGEGYIWVAIPASVLVSWIFHTMDKIGDASESPFQGGPNDVPITSMSRGIEIDMREMLGETELPPAIPPVNSILM